MSDLASSSLVVHGARIEPFDRGNGVVTLPYVGKWNSDANQVTTGMTVFAPGTAIPLPTHNLDEAVVVLEGLATAVIGEDSFELAAGDATWAAADVPHRFINRGEAVLRIYWAYGGRNVTRTMCATGKTVAHLSEEDRGATRA